MNDLDFKVFLGNEITDELFEEFYSLLTVSFTKNEYREKLAQKNLLNKKIYEIMFCFYEEKVIGAMAFWHVKDFIFVEHFAVSADARGHGVGTKMLDFIKDRFKIDVILEVELPYNEMNKKRINFYKRNGFHYNDFEYYQKPLNKGDSPLPLRIMSLKRPLNSENFKKIRDTLITSVYNA